MRPRLANLKHCRHPSRHPTIRFGIFHLIQAFLTFVMHQRKRSVHARVFLRVMDVAVSPYTLSDTVLFSTVGMCVYPQFVTIFPSFLPTLPPTTLHRNARTRPWLDRPSGMSNVLMGKSNGPLALGVIQYTHMYVHVDEFATPQFTRRLYS